MTEFEVADHDRAGRHNAVLGLIRKLERVNVPCSKCAHRRATTLADATGNPKLLCRECAKANHVDGMIRRQRETFASRRARK
jgi:hypothetical protein